MADEVEEYRGVRCMRCAGPVGLGHAMIGICSRCINTEKKVEVKQPNYLRETPKGGGSGFQY